MLQNIVLTLILQDFIEPDIYNWRYIYVPFYHFSNERKL